MGLLQKPEEPVDARPEHSKGLYSLSKVCQEVIAEQYAREFRIKTAVIRSKFIIDGETMSTKYGQKLGGYLPGLIDRTDIGEVCHKCLQLKDFEYETFHVYGTKEQLTGYDVQYTCDRLGWEPRYSFEE